MTSAAPPNRPDHDESRIADLRGNMAVAVGKRLIRKHPEFTGGYELAARGYEDLGRPKNAIKVLQQGIARRPHWRLLESLAVRYSECGRLEAALELLDDALGQAADQTSLYFNTALILERLERNEEALDSALRALQLDPGLSRAALLVASLECKLQRLMDGKARLEALIEILLLPEPEERENPVLSDAYRALAEVELAYKRRDSALGLFWRAIEHEKNNPVARYWIRELTGERSPDSCYRRIVVRGIWPREIPLPPGAGEAVEQVFRQQQKHFRDDTAVMFYVLYDVVSGSEEEALELVRPFEPPRVRESLRLDSAKIMKRSVTDPKGVYRTHPYQWASPEPAREDLKSARDS